MRVRTFELRLIAHRPGRLLDADGRPRVARLPAGRSARPRGGPAGARSGRHRRRSARSLAAGRARRVAVPGDRLARHRARCCSWSPRSRGSSPSSWPSGRRRSCRRWRPPIRGCSRSSATSLFSGFGIAAAAARADRDAPAPAGRAGCLVAVALTVGHRRRCSPAAAVANESPCATRSRARRASGRPTGRREPPLCDGGSRPAVRPSSSSSMSARRSTCDRSGRSTLTGRRDRARLPLARVRGDRPAARTYGAARIGERAWHRDAGDAAGARPTSRTRRPTTVDLQALTSRSRQAFGRPPRTAASRSSRAPARGAAGSPSTARRSGRRFRRSRWLVGGADLHRWRGQLDYWVFLDGQLGQVAGRVNGEAAGIVPEALHGNDRASG